MKKVLFTTVLSALCICAALVSCKKDEQQGSTSGGGSSNVTVSLVVEDEYDESGRRTESLESDMKEHIRAVFGIEGSSVKTVTLSLWPRNDPETYRIGLEGIRIELTDGTSVTVGRGV